MTLQHTPGGHPPGFLGMKPKNSTYMVSYQKDAIGPFDVPSDMTTIKVKAPDQYTAIQKAEKATIPRPARLFETLAYTFRIHGSKTAKSGFIHPRPKCIDIAGHARNTHFWQNASKPVSGLLQSEYCRRCGLERREFRWGRDPKETRIECIRRTPRFVGYFKITGSAPRGVTAKISKAFDSQIAGLARTVAAEKPSFKSVFNGSFATRIHTNLYERSGSSIDVWLLGAKGCRFRMRVDGITYGPDRTRYCRWCGRANGTGHELAMHKRNQIWHPHEAGDLRESGFQPVCSTCDGHHLYCSSCGTYIHWVNECPKHNHDSYKWRHLITLCAACEKKHDLN